MLPWQTGRSSRLCVGQWKDIHTLELLRTVQRESRIPLSKTYNILLPPSWLILSIRKLSRFVTRRCMDEWRSSDQRVEWKTARNHSVLFLCQSNIVPCKLMWIFTCEYGVDIISKIQRLAIVHSHSFQNRSKITTNTYLLTIIFHRPNMFVITADSVSRIFLSWIICRTDDDASEVLSFSIFLICTVYRFIRVLSLNRRPKWTHITGNSE